MDSKPMINERIYPVIQCELIPRRDWFEETDIVRSKFFAKTVLMVAFLVNLTRPVPVVSRHLKKDFVLRIKVRNDHVSFFFSVKCQSTMDEFRIRSVWLRLLNNLTSDTVFIDAPLAFLRRLCCYGRQWKHCGIQDTWYSNVVIELDLKFRGKPWTFWQYIKY